MTIVATFATLNEITLVADTRISASTKDGSILFYHDVCQKLYAANSWSVVGFAGDVCLGRSIVQGFVGHLAKADPHNTGWLQDDQYLQKLLRIGVGAHGRLRTAQAQVAHQKMRRVQKDHSECRRNPLKIVISWIDHSRDMLGQSTMGGEHAGPLHLETIILESPSMTIRRVPLFGLSVIGSGDQALTSVSSEELTDLSWFGMGQEHGRVQRAMMTSIMVKNLLREHNVPSVGDAHQVVVLDRFGVATVPYFYWANVAPGYGTYVAVRINRGEWCIEHRPTQVLIPVRTVMDFQIGHPDWKRRITKSFDPAKQLTIDSPGVVPETEWNLVHHVYDPDVVPDEIRASWGSQPLAQQHGPFKMPKRRRIRPI